MQALSKGNSRKQRILKRITSFVYSHIGSTQCPKDIEMTASEQDTPDFIQLDNHSVDAQSGTPPVKWHIGNTTVDREFVQYVTVYILIFIIAVTSLANLTAGSGSKELWASLLSMMCGIVVPQPKYPRKKQSDSVK